MVFKIDKNPTKKSIIIITQFNNFFTETAQLASQTLIIWCTTTKHTISTFYCLAISLDDREFIVNLNYWLAIKVITISRRLIKMKLHKFCYLTEPSLSSSSLMWGRWRQQCVHSNNLLTTVVVDAHLSGHQTSLYSID